MAHHGVQDVKTIPVAAAVAGGIGLVARRARAAAPGALPGAHDLRHRGRLPDDPAQVRPLHRRLVGHRPARAADRDVARQGLLVLDERRVALRTHVDDRGAVFRRRVVAASSRASGSRCVRFGTASSRQPRPGSTARRTRSSPSASPPRSPGSRVRCSRSTSPRSGRARSRSSSRCSSLVGAVVGLFGSIWGAGARRAGDRLPAGHRRAAAQRRRRARRPGHVLLRGRADRADARGAARSARKTRVGRRRRRARRPEGCLSRASRARAHRRRRSVGGSPGSSRRRQPADCRVAGRPARARAVSRTDRRHRRPAHVCGGACVPARAPAARRPGEHPHASCARAAR